VKLIFQFLQLDSALRLNVTTHGIELHLIIIESHSDAPFWS
jgi:hypothetical protein